VWEGKQTARFWEVQPMGFTDTGLTPGSSVRYRLRVSDSSGNYADSDWVTTTVASTGTVGAYGTKVLADGATKFWQLSETTRAVTDSAGVDDTTAGTGATRGTAGALQDGSNDRATTFNGTNSSVTVSPTLVWSPQQFSLETWFR